MLLAADRKSPLINHFYVGKEYVLQHNFCFQKLSQKVAPAFKQLI